MARTFIPNPVIDDKVNALLDLFGHKSRGDIVPYEVVSDVIDCKIGDDLWRRVLGKAKRRLLKESGIQIMAERKVGLRLLSEDDQLNKFQRIKRFKSRRQLAQGLAAAQAISPEELDPIQKRIREAQIMANNALLMKHGETEEWVKRELSPNASVERGVRPVPVKIT